MDIILNDFSLDGQFVNEQDFADSVNENTLPMLKEIVKMDFPIYKNYSSYKDYVTTDLMFSDILKTANNPDITLLKKYLADLSIDEPYWEDDIKTDRTSTYVFNIGIANSTIPNCFTEAVERDKQIISFIHKDFNKDIHGVKDNGEFVINNSFNMNSFLNNSFGVQAIDILELLTNYDMELLIEAFTREDKCYCKEILESKDLTPNDLTTIKNDIIEMVHCISKAIRTRFSKDLGDSLYEFRTTISDSNEFRIFYIYSKHQCNTIVLLNGIIKKSQNTPAEALKLARRLAKEYNS
ncbi:type II toxin-antitoxin system RelE/ParE family toxin [Clostridium carnis]|nr:type II toxin-antitoxin system RelE/ParE family toxin [Clostridium carnis]